MIIKAYGEHHEYLLFIDLEFNQRKLIQFAGILFRRIDEETYQLWKSYNCYVTSKVCYPFVEYTNITNSFLQENGVPLNDIVSFINDDFFHDVNKDKLLIVSHGLKNDRAILLDAGIKLSKSDGTTVDGYCTFTNARRILQRENQLSLEDLSNEAGYYLHMAHNAYNDAWAEVSVFTFLRKVEQTKGD